MTPRYFTWSCINCDDSIIEADCVCGGKYCAMDEERLSYSGKDIIMENLRQKCLFKTNQEAWWGYIEKAHKLCYTDFTESCSEIVHKDLKMDFKKTQDCVANSFDDVNNENDMLNKDSVEWVLRGPHFIPAVVINKIAYRGELDPENVFKAICEGFKDPQVECTTHIMIDELNKKSISFTWFIAALILIVLVNVGIVFLCKRCSSREMKTNVNTAISEYMSLRKANGRVELSDDPMAKV